MSETILLRLVDVLRACADAFTPGDQVPPCAVLWPDPQRQWERVLPHLQAVAPELFVLGAYAPDKRTGPALWMRCLEARTVEGAPPEDTPPIFYLPGVSREQLGMVEECAADIVPLVELQFRGNIWLQDNGKEWTPQAFLSSQSGGLSLDVPRDQATLDALAGALQNLMQQPIPNLRNRRLDAAFFNELVAPDVAGMLLRWLNDPDAFQRGLDEAAWAAFRQQCRTNFQFDPSQDGPRKAAQSLAGRGGRWSEVWLRFADMPAKYPGVVGWLRRASPRKPGMLDTAEVWPHVNEQEEERLRADLMDLGGRSHDEAIRRVADLEAQHGVRRGHPWQELGLSPFATALESLAEVANLCAVAPGAPSAGDFGDYYFRNGWRVDAAALAAVAACASEAQRAPVAAALRSLYLPWLDQTAREIQNLALRQKGAFAKRHPPFTVASGQLIVFVDALRMDVAQLLVSKLAASDVVATMDWEWSTVPSVTPTAKPAASPIESAFQGSETTTDFSTRLAATGQPLTQDRFVNALRSSGWRVLDSSDDGDHSGSAWVELGDIDSQGHNDAWRLARNIDSTVSDIAARIQRFLRDGWAEVVVVSDHGWLLMPGGLPRVELKSFLAEERWGRCAAVKPGNEVAALSLPWYWHPDVVVASPPGVGCFYASKEYAHGGVSLQEMVTPVIRARVAAATGGAVRLSEVRWTGAKCRILVRGDTGGVRVDVRTRPSDASTSLLSDQQSREVGSNGKVTVFLENDADIGKEAEVVLLDASMRVVDARSTIIGA